MVHFRPESVVHFAPELLVHFAPESVVHFSPDYTAIMYSLIETCKAQEVDPREWMTDVLSRMSLYNNDYKLDLADLLPHNWKKARRCQPVSD